MCSLFQGRRFDLVKWVDLKEHVGKLTALADGGDVFAQYELGSYYEPADRKLMAKYYKMAAEQGFAFAQKELSSCYYCGHGVEKNTFTARIWLIKAYNQGLYNEIWIAKYCPYCFDENLKWLLRGLARDERKFVSELGYFYYQSGGDKYRNYAKAIEYYNRSIELGSTNGYDEYFIANMYLKGGYGITANRSTASEWYKIAADKGCSSAEDWLKENPY